MNKGNKLRAGITRAAFSLVLIGSLAAVGVSFGMRQTRRSTDPPLPPRGKLGQDLFIAIDHRDTKAVQDLLDKGADPNSTNGLQFTPLYIAAASHQPEVMEALLKAGAKPDAASTYGTPLTFACATANLEGAELLLSKGVDVNYLRSDGMTPLMMASNAGFPPLVAELIKHKADVNAKDDGGETALSLAARNGNTGAAQVLLGSGAKVDNVDEEGLTPLMLAAQSGHADFVQMLLKSGAKPNLKDRKGATAIVLASSYGDYPDVVQALVEGGADDKIADSKGRTAFRIAAGRGFEKTAVFLKKTNRGRIIPPRMRSPKDAVSLSLKTLQASMLEFNRSTTCISCHQEGLGRIATGEARSHGFKLDTEVSKAQRIRLDQMLVGMRPLHEGALKNPEMMKQVPLVEMNEVGTMYTWLLVGMAAQDQAPNVSSAAMAMVLARQQSPMGAWTLSLPRVPMQSSPFTFTALSIRALKAYGPKAYASEIAERLGRAKQWLMTAKPGNSEDRASRLLALKWVGADAKDIQEAAEAVRADQHPDGGWTQLPNTGCDAYATGQALYALHVAGGMPVNDPVYRRGVMYLTRTQDEDGTWFVTKRAIPANNYFDAGFPHGESQYASFNGTCWATMALLETIQPKKG